VTQNYKDGNYQNSKMEIWWGDGTKHHMDLNNEKGAARLTLFLDRLAFLNHGTDGAASTGRRRSGRHAREASLTGASRQLLGRGRGRAEIPAPEKAAPSRRSR
jgi:hypothetical protein